MLFVFPDQSPAKHGLLLFWRGFNSFGSKVSLQSFILQFKLPMLFIIHVNVNVFVYLTFL